MTQSTTSPSKIDVEGLIERVEKATGPDRELDLDIAAALFTDGEDAAWWQRRKARFLSSHMLVDAAPEYTASIDAALALTERVLPGRWADILRDAIGKMGARYDWHMAFSTGEQKARLPKYVILTTLKALQAQGETE